jgi:hypothetical protein
MAVRVDVYQGGGIAGGLLEADGRLRDALETVDRVALERATWTPLDGTPAQTGIDLLIAIDDALIVVAEDDPHLPVHAVWHTVHLAVGPYLVDGELPTMPGFDPGRALTRPSGSFVQLRDVRVRLALDPDGGSAEHAHAFVNRYAVDEVESDLMLSFFFPGAHVPPAATAGT